MLSQCTVFIADTNPNHLRSTASPQINPPALTASVGAFQDMQQSEGLLPSLARLGLLGTEAGIGVSKLVLGQKRRNYSNKDTDTSMETVMGKPVRVEVSQKVILFTYLTDSSSLLKEAWHVLL